MSKRIQISVSDELHEWVRVEAENLSIPTSTMVTILVTEARKSRENAANLKAVFDRMKAIDPETFAKMVATDMSQIELPMTDGD